MVGAKHRGWQGAVAHVAMIALLFRALLVPAGCPVPPDAGPLTSVDSPAIHICSVHGGQDTGGAADPDAGSGKKSHHTSPACASACCAVAAPVAAALFDPPSAGQRVFNIETRQAPASAACLALRNRGPPVTLSV